MEEYSALEVETETPRREAVPTVTFTQAARRPDMRAPIGITAAALLVALVMISADVVEVSNNLA